MFNAFVTGSDLENAVLENPDQRRVYQFDHECTPVEQKAADPARVIDSIAMLLSDLFVPPQRVGTGEQDRKRCTETARGHGRSWCIHLSDRNAGDVQFHPAPGRRVLDLKCRPRPPANLAIGRSVRLALRTGVPYVRDPAAINSGSPRRPTPENQNSTSTTGRSGMAIKTEEHIMRG